MRYHVTWRHVPHSAQYKASTSKGAPTKSFFRLDIDIQRNEPNIYKEQQLPNPEGWHGAEVSVTIAGNWQYYRAKILRYLRQIAVITPYAEVRHLNIRCVHARF